MSTRQLLGGDTGTAADVGDPTTATYTVTLPNVTLAGNTLLIFVVSNATVATPSGFTKDVSQVNNCGAYVFRKTAVAGESSWTVTPSVAAAGCWCAMEVDGLLSSPVDQTVSDGAFGGSFIKTTGTTGATSQADELAFALFGGSIGVVPGGLLGASATNGFTPFLDNRQSNPPSGTRVALALGFSHLGATGTVESTITWTDTPSTSAMIVTYKAAAQVTKAHAAQARLSDPRWRDTLAQGRLVARRTKTHSAQALLRASLVTSTGVHAAQARLVARRTATHSARTTLKATTPAAHLARAILRQTSTKAHGAAGGLRGSLTATHGSAAVLRALGALTHGSRAILRRTGTTSHAARASLRGTSLVTHTAGTTLRGTTSHAHGARAILQLQGLTRAHGAAARLSGVREASHGARALLSNPTLTGAVSVALSAPRVLLTDRATGSVQLVVSYDP